MKEEDVKVIMRRFMAKWGYECLTEKGTIRQTLSVLKKHDNSAYNRLRQLLPFGWVMRMDHYDENGNVAYNSSDVLIVDDLFHGCDIIKYTFNEYTSPFQRKCNELPPEDITLEYKTRNGGAHGLRAAIGQALCYQIETRTPVYLVIFESLYNYMKNVCSCIPIGFITYNENLEIIVVQNIEQKVIPFPNGLIQRQHIYI